MNDTTTRVRGIIRLGLMMDATWSEALVAADEITLDSPMGRVHLPAGTPTLEVTHHELRATIPEWGLTQFTPWRSHHWVHVLRTNGWL